MTFEELVEKGEMKGTDRSVHVCPSRQISELQAGTEKVCPLHFAFFNKLLVRHA